MSILQSIRNVPLTIILTLFFISLVWGSAIWLIIAYFSLAEKGIR